MIYVFGHTGLLGRYVYKYLTEQGREVKGISTKEMDLRYELPDLNVSDIVVNCAGLIPSKIESTEDAILLNSLMPHKVNEQCNLIHISTDCVFSGKDGNYGSYSPKDATDIYGQSKSLGECGMVIRTSFVGEGGGLLQWMLDTKEDILHGYKNHYWSGVTCLQLAEFISSCIDKFNPSWIFQFTTIGQSKLDLLNHINQAYNLNKRIIQVTLGNKLNRILENNAYDIDSSYYDIRIEIEKQCGYL